VNQPGQEPVEWEAATRKGLPVVVLLDRGNHCTFVQKVQHAQDAAASAAIIVDNDPTEEGDGLPVMANDGNGNNILIPSILISKVRAMGLWVGWKRLSCSFYNVVNDGG
jgi:hypothetical protein